MSSSIISGLMLFTSIGEVIIISIAILPTTEPQSEQTWSCDPMYSNSALYEDSESSLLSSDEIGIIETEREKFPPIVVFANGIPVLVASDLQLEIMLFLPLSISGLLPAGDLEILDIIIPSW